MKLKSMKSLLAHEEKINNATTAPWFINETDYTQNILQYMNKHE